MKLFFFALIFIYSFGSVAHLQCQDLFKSSSEEILNKVNIDHNNVLFTNSLRAKAEQSFWLIKYVQLYRINRILKNFDKDSENYDSYELKIFITKLERLAFANYIEVNPEAGAKLSLEQKRILADARRSVVFEGLSKNLDLKNAKSNVLRKLFNLLQNLTSQKIWRWFSAPVWMPQLVDFSLPPDLAKQIILDGIDAHSTELTRYYPGIKYRDQFNYFSRLHHLVIFTALFTVFPYMYHEIQIEQTQKAEAAQLEMIRPLAENSNKMTQVNQEDVVISMQVEAYKQLFFQKYHRQMTESELKKLEKFFRSQ